jgi:polyphosphate kinase
MEIKKKTKVHGKFINRELSLIDFNERVLSCALSKNTPLNERLNFLAITDSNFDEVISVRFANAYHNQDDEPYSDILKRIKSFKKMQNEAYKILKDELGKNGIKFVKISDLNKKEKENLYNEYMTNIFPLLTPLHISNCNSIPPISSGELCIVVTIMNNGIEEVVIIPIENEIDKLYQIGDKVIMIEDIITYYMNDTLFINKDIVSKGVFRIIRDASIILSHDTSRFIVDRMSETIRKREHSNPLFIEISSSSPERLKNILMSIFKIPNGHVYTDSKILYYKRFSQPILDSSESYKSFEPFIYENNENYYNMFEAIRNEDILLQHPYDSYDTVVKFIQHAANDKDVVAIKQTLYRVSSIDSPIVDALCKASKNGKKVSVLVEIKARFDEENNIRLISKLQNAGVTVILGMEYLKTHCKLCVIIRNENNKLCVYSHVATGNYNEKTARLYTDLSYFTSKQKIGIDLLHIFNILSGHSNPDEKLQKIYYSPVTLRKRLINCIDREITFAKNGKKAEIFMKINSLSDKIMANKIYEAADKGVKVYIVCRGVCSIVPRKNLFIKSIVGRFLEHSRIYYFKNGNNHEYYISSADLLTRNLDKRVETLISLKDSSVVEQLQWMIDVYKEDKRNSFVMDKKGIWHKQKGDFSCHDWFIKHSDDRTKIKKG